MGKADSPAMLSYSELLEPVTRCRDNDIKVDDH